MTAVGIAHVPAPNTPRRALRKHRAVADLEDGCPGVRHLRDELCAQTPLGSLPPIDEPQPEGDRGGAS